MTQMQIGMVVATTLKKELRECEGNVGLCGSGHWQAIEAGVVLSPDNVAHSISLRAKRERELTCNNAQNTYVKAVLKKTGA